MFLCLGFFPKLINMHLQTLKKKAQKSCSEIGNLSTWTFSQWDRRGDVFNRRCTAKAQMVWRPFSSLDSLQTSPNNTCGVGTPGVLYWDMWKLRMLDLAETTWQWRNQSTPTSHRKNWLQIQTRTFHLAVFCSQSRPVCAGSEARGLSECWSTYRSRRTVYLPIYVVWSTSLSQILRGIEDGSPGDNRSPYRITEP